MTDHSQAALNVLADLQLRVRELQLRLSNPNTRGTATERKQWVQELRSAVDQLYKHIDDMEQS